MPAAPASAAAARAAARACQREFFGRQGVLGVQHGIVEQQIRQRRHADRQASGISGERLAGQAQALRIGDGGGLAHQVLRQIAEPQAVLVVEHAGGRRGAVDHRIAQVEQQARQLVRQQAGEKLRAGLGFAADARADGDAFGMARERRQQDRVIGGDAHRAVASAQALADVAPGRGRLGAGLVRGLAEIAAEGRQAHIDDAAEGIRVGVAGRQPARRRQARLPMLGHRTDRADDTADRRHAVAPPLQFLVVAEHADDARNQGHAECGDHQAAGEDELVLEGKAVHQHGDGGNEFGEHGQRLWVTAPMMATLCYTALTRSGGQAASAAAPAANGRMPD